MIDFTNIDLNNVANIFFAAAQGMITSEVYNPKEDSFEIHADKDGLVGLYEKDTGNLVIGVKSVILNQVKEVALNQQILDAGHPGNIYDKRLFKILLHKFFTHTVGSLYRNNNYIHQYGDPTTNEDGTVTYQYRITRHLPLAATYTFFELYLTQDKKYLKYSTEVFESIRRLHDLASNRVKEIMNDEGLLETVTQFFQMVRSAYSGNFGVGITHEKDRVVLTVVGDDKRAVPVMGKCGPVHRLEIKKVGKTQPKITPKLVIGVEQGTVTPMCSVLLGALEFFAEGRHPVVNRLVTGSMTYVEEDSGLELVRSTFYFADLEIIIDELRMHD